MTREPEDIEEPRVLDEVVRAIRSLQYGSVQITVHDGKVAEISTTKKWRPPLRK